MPESFIPTPENQPKTPSERTAVELGQTVLPRGRRVETSAWHRIELDAKTGKPVENPTLEYGREYHQERHPEAAPIDQDVKEAAGEVALVAAALTNHAEPDTTVPVLPDIPSASTRQPLAPAVLPSNGHGRYGQTAAGPLWPYLVVLVIIGVALFFALR